MNDPFSDEEFERWFFDQDLADQGWDRDSARISWQACRERVRFINTVMTLDAMLRLAIVAAKQATSPADIPDDILEELLRRAEELPG